MLFPSLHRQASELTRFGSACDGKVEVTDVAPRFRPVPLGLHRLLEQLYRCGPPGSFAFSPSLESASDVCLDHTLSTALFGPPRSVWRSSTSSRFDTSTARTSSPRCSTRCLTLALASTGPRYRIPRFRLHNRNVVRVTEAAAGSRTWWGSWGGARSGVRSRAERPRSKPALGGVRWGSEPSPCWRADMSSYAHCCCNLLTLQNFPYPPLSPRDA